MFFKDMGYTYETLPSENDHFISKCKQCSNLIVWKNITDKIADKTFYKAIDYDPYHNHEEMVRRSPRKKPNQ